ncbi:retrotransposon protein, putative, ty1-copia subclass [Tanacetum coccineum]
MKTKPPWQSLRILLDEVESRAQIILLGDQENLMAKMMVSSSLTQETHLHDLELSQASYKREDHNPSWAVDVGLIQTFHACKPEEGKPVGPYVFKMKNYVVQLERLGYVLPRDLSVGLILNDLTSDFARFVRNHNKHNMEKTIDKKVATPQVMAIQSGRIQRANKKSHNAKRKGKGKGKGKDKTTSLPLRMNLLKHKHEVFETFKVFKNEVENQLGKTIKALRSDRGGEYISQEFKDYLKACGIVQQLTLLYTPQHNGVSERRNPTLLDMVRSMMNLTTLPLSFWDYALESAACILNMVPTKKGCEALVKRDTPDKLQQRSVKVYLYRIPKGTYGVRAGELEEIQDEDSSPSEITSEIPMEVEDFEPPQEEEAPVHSKGFLKPMGDYEENISPPIADIIAIIAIVAFYDYEIWKMDVKTAFLNGYLDEDIYMVQPEGFIDPKHPKKVCKLQRSIYGLKLDLNKTQGASTPGEVKRMQNVPYASAVGSIMYAVRCTRPDVAFAQNITSRFQQNPGEPHWTAVKTILKYLRNTKDMFLVYGRNPEAELRVDCYCNAGFETDRDEIKSQT